MAVGVGGVAVGAEQQARAVAARPARREVARGLLTTVAALALAPVVAASRPAPPAADPDGGSGSSFDETYRGRRIRGVLVPAADRKTAEGNWRITIDGRPLHLMRRADGTWLSMVDHYTSHRTPLEATRAAVDEIGPDRQLRDLAPGPVGGEHTGVRGGAITGNRRRGHRYLEGPGQQGGQHGVRA
ncbi:tyrosinase [Streptomyces pluripotens]|uniref:Tyrosinase n=1 Tax=Streptomyces pluripotens TaxID=1355015 RepID=A0A221NX05_9ACTN|nr:MULTISPECIES: tyrosinase family oxidase copper chaperone [Streptomyces]ARP70286.1 tyrosinase [Streptomyces pluripotens]ASN24543.1 tyrosinase [Streptomyces pluripotens]MCH0558387.1 tyrosinase [Streptomyces sp. MUM 16J]